MYSYCRGCRRRHWCSCFFFQAEDGIRDLVRSRGLGDVYKRQANMGFDFLWLEMEHSPITLETVRNMVLATRGLPACLLYTSDAAAERSSVDLGGRRIIKKKKKTLKMARTRPIINITTRKATQT